MKSLIHLALTLTGRHQCHICHDWTPDQAAHLHRDHGDICQDHDCTHDDHRQPWLHANPDWADDLDYPTWAPEPRRWCHCGAALEGNRPCPMGCQEVEA